MLHTKRNLDVQLTARGPKYDHDWLGIACPGQGFGVLNGCDEQYKRDGHLGFALNKCLRALALWGPPIPISRRAPSGEATSAVVEN